MKTHIKMLFFLVLLSAVSFAQTKKFKIYDNTFIIKSIKIGNEWNTTDDVRNLYIKGNETEKLVLRYFAYKDEGGDSDNLFWYKEKLKIKGNSMIITTHHFQKTGLDPIAEWERRTFVVSENGEVELTEHLFKKVGSNEWKSDNEWFNR